MIRRLVRGALTLPPICGLLHQRTLSKRPLTILCYHTLSADTGGPDAWTALRISDFRSHLALLRRHYSIVGLEHALEQDDNDLPAAVLTFDDGDLGLHRHLQPLLREQQLPVTIYVATGQIETGRPYWFDRVMNACQGSSHLEIDLTDAGLGNWKLDGTGKRRWSVMSALLEALKRVDPTSRETLADRVANLAPVHSGPALGPMTVADLQDLAALPHVTIGAHSHCHNLLDQISLDQARDSIKRSRTLLEEWTGREIRHFAYPNGNHTSALRALIKEQGFASATVLDDALAWRGGDRFALSRLAVGRYDRIAKLRLQLAGV